MLAQSNRTSEIVALQRRLSEVGERRAALGGTREGAKGSATSWRQV